MKIAISLDSACDASEEVKGIRVQRSAFRRYDGRQIFYDGEVDTLEIFEYADANKTLPKTNAVNEEQFNEHFKNFSKRTTRLYTSIFRRICPARITTR